MKKYFLLFALGAALSVRAHAQNWTTVSATNITDLNQQKLAAGQLCFLPTDQNDNPVSVGIGGGGQTLRRAYCSLVSSGAVTNFTVPNPANTAPSGLYYRVTVKDSSTGQEVLRYPQVTFSGTTFNFDNYAPTSSGNFAPLGGTNVTGNLSVSGNVSATGTISALNIPSAFLQQIFSTGTALTQRTGLNATAGLQCADNTGTQRTDCRLGTFTVVTFSATPAFDASTTTTFKITLTGNVTSSTLTGAVAGEPIAFLICQDATGGRTFAAPSNVVGFVTIPSGANQCILETFIYDGANAQADQDVASQLKGPEAVALSGAAGFDLLYADSTAHRWKMINNNGAALTVAATSGDTLTSTTLTGAASGNSVTLLNSQGVTATLTGNATDQVVYTYTLPANTMQAGKGIRITVAWLHSAGTASVTYKLNFGSSSACTAFSSASTSASVLQIAIMNNSGSQANQRCSGMAIGGTSVLNTVAGNDPIQNTTGSLTISFTFNVAATDQLIGGQFLVEQIQ